MAQLNIRDLDPASITVIENPPVVSEQKKKLNIKDLDPSTIKVVEGLTIQDRARAVGKGLVDQLTTAGALVGGSIGLASPVPGGTLIGAGLGAGLGESVRGAIQSKLYPDEAPKSLKDALLRDVSTAAKTAAAEGAGAIAGNVSKEIGKTKVAQQIKTGLGKATSAAGDFASKVSSELTGISKDSIKEFASDPKAINALSKKESTEVADTIRRNLRTALESKRQELSSSIGRAVSKSDPSKKINIKSVIDELGAAKNRLDAVLEKQDIADIQKIIDRVSELSPSHEVSLKQLNDLKGFLQKTGSPAFNSKSLFAAGESSQRAAKAASSTARSLLNKESNEIAKANKSLQQIRIVEKNANKNLFTEGTPDAALIAAGKGNNPRNLAILKRLGEISGTDPVKLSKQLAASKEFKEATSFSKIPTGRALFGVATGSAVGGVPGALAGAILSSPTALKKAIELGAISAKVASGAAKITDEVLIKNLSKTDAGRALIEEVSASISGNEGPIQRRLNKTNGD